MSEQTTEKKPELRPAAGRWTRADGWAFALIVAGTLALNAWSLDRPLVASHDAKSGLIDKQMVEQGRWFVTNVEVGWVNKPPLFYWAGAGISLATGGLSEWAVRLPSAIACALCAGLAFALARELFGRRAGIIAGVVLATMVHFHLLAQATRLDSVVMPTVLGAVYGYVRALSAPGGSKGRSSWGWAFFGHASLLLGVLAKGPLVIGLAGLVMLGWLIARALTRRSNEGTVPHDLKRLHVVTGAVFILAVSVPVFLAMDYASGHRFLSFFFLHEHLARAGVSMEDVGDFKQHTYPFWYYAVTIWFGAAPWSVLLPAGFVAAWRAREYGRSARLLPIIYFALPFVFFSIIGYKKWPYLMTVYPPMAILIGKFIDDATRGAALPAAEKWLARLASAGFLIVTAMTLVSAWAVADDRVLPAISGPEGFIHARRPLGLPDELDAIRGRVWDGTLPIIVGALTLGTAAVLLWRSRIKAAAWTILAIAVVGSVYFETIVRPALVARTSQMYFAQRVNDRVRARALMSSPRPEAWLCSWEAFELRYYLLAEVKSAKVPDFKDEDAFFRCLRPADSREGRWVEVIMLKNRLLQVEKIIGPFDILMSTGPNESIDKPVVLVGARLVLPARTGAEGAPPSPSMSP